MEFFNSLNLTQIKGGTKLKQGDLGSVLSYSLTDENGQEITSFDTKTAYINLVLDDKIWFTTTTLVDISRVTFRIDKAIPIGLYYLEIKIDDYIFPSDRDSIILIEEGSTPYDLKELVPNYDINMTLKGILSDLSQKGIDISDLNRRIGNANAELIAQLAEKVNKDEVTNVMTPKGNIAYASLPMTGNSVGWYYYCPDGDGTHGAGNYVWNGTSWYFGGTGDEGYNLLKEDLDMVVVDNDLIKDTTLYDGYLDESGKLVEGNKWKTTDFLPIKTGNTFTIDYNGMNTSNEHVTLPRRIMGYDKNKKLVCEIYIPNDAKIVIEDIGIEYIRVNFYRIDYAYVYRGTERFSCKGVTELEERATELEERATELEERATELEKQFVVTDLFKNKSYTVGKFVRDTNGNVEDLRTFASYFNIDISMFKGESLYSRTNDNDNYGRSVVFYDINGSYISGVYPDMSNYESGIIVPEDAETMSCSCSTEYLDGWSITALTKNKDDVFLDKKIILDATQVKNLNIPVIDNKVLSKAEHRICTINFQFDDGHVKDSAIYEIFKNHGFVCGFALLSSNTRDTEYLKYQNEGFEILSHSIDGDGMEDGSISESVIENKLITSKKVLQNKGYNIRGWVTPSSVMNTAFVHLLRKYYDYGFTIYYGEHTPTNTPYFTNVADLCRLSRVSVQNTTLENQKDAVDKAIINNGFLTFYGHSAGLDGSDNQTTENLNALLEYISEKVSDLQCYVLKPSDAVDYYFHVRHSDLINN